MKKTIIITGASDGIGVAAATQLQRSGNTVVVVGRSPEKTAAVAATLGADHFVADFADLESVRELAASLAKRYSRIDVLANNAGGVFGVQETTADGFEKTFQVNHLAPFLLTNLLLPTLVQSSATVIQTASIAARLYGKLDVADLNNARRYSPNKAYGDSKLENILFTKELHRRYQAQGITAAAFHPGLIASSFATETTSFSMKMLYANPLTKRLLKSSSDGADQLVWLAETDAGTTWQSGDYYEKRRVATRINPQSDDMRLAGELWEASAALVGV